MTNVQQSVEVDYNIRQAINNNTGLVYNVDTTLSAPSVSLPYNVYASVSQSKALVYNTLMSVVPSKLLSAAYNVLQTQSTSKSISYNVLVPVSAVSESVVYNTLATVSPPGKSIVYNVLNNYPAHLTISLGISYHVLVTPTTTRVDTAPIRPDSVPPQIVVTSIAGG